MKIEVAYRIPLRRWQQKLAGELRSRGHHVALVAYGRKTLGLKIAAVLALEQAVFGPRPSLFDKVMPEDTNNRLFDEADLTIALDGVSRDAGRCMTPLFAGVAGDSALLAMLLGGHAPTIRVAFQNEEASIEIVTASVAVEDRDILSRGLDQVLARLVTLLMQAVRRIQSGKGPLPLATAPAVTQSAPPQPLRHVARAFAGKISARMPGGGRRGPPHWRIGYRRIADGTMRSTAWGRPAFTILADDASRFYADPMPFTHEARTYLFVEDFPYATGKAVIAVTEIDATGRAATPRTVLEQPCHLSYPLILRHGGEIYMMPEMSGAGRIQLFRADPFPIHWVADRILLDGITASDATAVEHGGRWWIFATSSDDGGSSWDQLCLFHAPDLLGPWVPHIDNPVLVDAGAARPAGAMWHQDGALMRIAQDCRSGYGVGLAICRVDRLDEEGYAQTVVGSLQAPGGYGADGVHTLNRIGDFEVIDLRFSDSAAPCPCPAAPLLPAHD